MNNFVDVPAIADKNMICTATVHWLNVNEYTYNN